MAKKIKKLQSQVEKVADLPQTQPAGLIPCLFLAEEAGEVVKCFKHAMKDGVEIDDKDVQEEIGDVFLAALNLCNQRGYDSKEIINKAIKKLSDKTGKSLDDEDEKSFEVNEE